jgi:hypothetical protein
MCLRALPYWQSWKLVQEALFADMQKTGTTGSARNLSDLTTIQFERALCLVLQHQRTSNSGRYTSLISVLDELCAEEEEKARIATWYEGDSPNPLARLRRPIGLANRRR